jgi:serine phosphatase RsbU (regulator of sigma subunit)
LSDSLKTILPLSISVGGHELQIENLATIGLIGVMCWLLLRQLWQDWRAKEELGAEFDAARSMQAKLVPAAVDVPGFRIESAYHPARQVGGDFFRILPEEDGAVLVIVGDVSGKGLGAALTVAAIAGALDNEFSRRPGEVLEHLNRALLLRKGEGFVTCCAALIETSGDVTVANAGHLAPYAGALELPVDAELPLGLSPVVSYGEGRLRIGTCEALTFVTDGVVEAASAKGELFGFERTREISTRSAQEIAEAARAWGQNDDITVVTVRRNS